MTKSSPNRTIIVTGGIVSGLGKGITAASIGRLLIDRGYTAMPVKADPYLNVDAGTMNPFQHGEVFVTEDGTESDLDLGHYERFMDINLSRFSSFTSGAVYRAVMDKEREGEFLGKTIQIIPHITDEIKDRLYQASDNAKPDFLICEVGGTVGDIEALPFIEAIRQYQADPKTPTILVHVVKMDYLYPSDEGKTKPIQHAVTTLRSYGLQPTILIVRCKRPLKEDERQKIALFTGVPATHIIPAPDADSLYSIPAVLEEQGLGTAVLDSFGLEDKKTATSSWDKVLNPIKVDAPVIKVGLVGKYTDHSDAYLSVIESVSHAGIEHGVRTKVIPVSAEDTVSAEQLKDLDAVIVPGGFGSRGVDGKISAIKWARENKVPFLGICLGLQTATLEIARDLAGLEGANSTEFDENTPHPVVAILPDQLHIKKKGGTMRLGSYAAKLIPGSLIHQLYSTYRPDEVKNDTITERHRHRYEVNPEYHEQLKKAGLVISGQSPDGSLVEFIELDQKDHPYFVATQAHPEFRSRPNRAHPLFAGLIKAALEQKK